MERQAIVSGTFYPSDKAKLSSQIAGLFSQAGAQEKYRIVVSPHAGYVYSGLAAASAIGSLLPASTFIVLGPNHTGQGQEFSIMGEGTWKTPLGEIEIDSATSRTLKKAGMLEEDGWAHASEHSIEVQLPFLQHRFPAAKLVPVCMMGQGYSESFLRDCERLGELIGLLMKDDGKREGGMEKEGDHSRLQASNRLPANIGLVASSDFSHYVPAKSAEKYDMQAIEKITSLDVKGFFQTLQKNRASVCGYGPIAVAMAAAKSLGLTKGELIKYMNSGDATKDYSSVVAYAALGFC
jgi:hypothetical protein